MKPRNRLAPLILACMSLAAMISCAPSANSGRVARSTLVIGIDVSESFQSGGRYTNAIDFAAYYIYGHLHGLGDLRVPTAVFVGSVGGDRPGEAKSFQPIHTFQGKSVEEIANYLRLHYPSNDGLTDFNPFFQRVATLIKRQGLVLAPLNVVILSDGVPDLTASSGATSDNRYKKVDVGPLEYLSRNVTVRMLYPTPTVAVAWERQVPRRRVRMWTVDAEVMRGWRKQMKSGAVPEKQADLWKWVQDNVDFRVRSAGIL